MTSAEAAATGPRYAPDDPTLPQPWKGLIDGGTGTLYYWNPDTNVTQYERPAAPAPPLPAGLPPPAAMPKLAPIPTARSMVPNGAAAQPQQQMTQQPAQQQHQMLYHQPQQMPNQQPQQYPPMQQMPYQQASYMQGQMMQQQRPQDQQMQGGPHDLYQQQQQRQQMQGPQGPYQQAQPNAHEQGPPQQDSHALHSQGQQSPGLQVINQQAQHSKPLQVLDQQGQQPHGAQSMHQQGQRQGQQNTNQQVQQPGFPRGEDPGRPEGRHTGFSMPLVHQTIVNTSTHQHMPSVGHQVQISPIGISSMSPQERLGGPSPFSSQQTGPPSIPQQAGLDPSHRQWQMGSSIVSNQMDHSAVRPPAALKLGYQESPHERLGNEFHSSGGPMVSPRQPKLAALPPIQNHQDMRMGSNNPPFIPPGRSGGLDMAPGHAMPNMYDHAAFPNAAPMQPSLRMSGPPDHTHMSSVDAYRQHHEVSAMGDNVPAPFMSFETTGFPPEILRELQLAGFSSPTPIQAQSWPLALESRDIVAIARTGSGKTLGYLIPAFIHLRRCRNNPQSGPTVLVLAPTRELATQIQEEAIKFGRSSRVSCTCLYGGAPKGPQLREIERGVDIIVATPGRLNDILEMKKIDFRQVSFLVLDEADRMLDMGFEPQIRKIVNEIPPRRQTLMYTATWPKEVRKIAGDLLVNPVQVNIGSVDELAANKSITQYVEVVPQMDKQRRLEQILRTQERGSKIIIFCSTKRLCDQLARSIGRTFGAAAIHGDKSQGERDHVLNQFRSGQAPILVATDVAARGLDVKDIRVVVNYDFPTGIEDYVHRIGRTGRAGATGLAYTFFSDQDWKYAADLVKLLEGADQNVPPEVREMAARGGPVFPRPRGGMNNSNPGAGRWDSGGRSTRDGGFGGRGGMRDGGSGLGGRGGMRDGGSGLGGRGSVRDGGSGFGGRGSMRDDGSGFGGRSRMRDDGGGFGGRGGRNDFYGRGGGRGRGLGGPPERPGGWGRNERGPQDRFNNSDGRGRFDNRRRIGDRSRDRSYSRSPERVRTWGYDRSRSQSRSRSRSRSISRSRSGSRRRSWSRSSSRSRSRSRSYDRFGRSQGRNFSHPPAAASSLSHPPATSEAGAPGYQAAAAHVSGFDVPPPIKMPAVSLGKDNGNELADQLPGSNGGRLAFPEPGTVPEPSQHQASDL